MKLYRPVGMRELELIKQSGMTKFPPRLPEQPIFYPVLNIEYARQIAQEWNTKSAPGFAGFVTEFEVDDEYISRFEVKTVGASIHKELWIPAEELDDFNNHIVGNIEVVESYYGDSYKGTKPETSELSSLAAIERLKNGNMQVLKNEKWLMYLALTPERNINFERLNSLDEMRNNYVLSYVEKTLRRLNEFKLSEYQRYIIEETLKWSEVAKSGLLHHREQWIKRGYNLFVHNIGSSQIYMEQSGENNPDAKRMIRNLILAHGSIGQYIRGEVSLKALEPLFDLGEDNELTEEKMKEILMVLNYCIISAVDEVIWNEVREQVEAVIELIIQGQFEELYDTRERIGRLRTVSIKNGEDFDAEYQKLFADARIAERFNKMLDSVELWYVEAALFDFSFEEFLKIFLIIIREADFSYARHISFEKFMKDLYYQHEGKKRVNIYKKRIIERYLSEITIEDILEGRFKDNLHVIHEVSYFEDLDDIVFFTFRFSAAGSKLIDFCVEAEKADVLYESAIILLFDLFGLRKDKYDRFYEEESYLQTMNQTIDYKRVILDFITGESIIDIGPGGGALMDLIEKRYPQKRVLGVDIAQNVLDSLKKKKQLEGRNWDVLYGDALNLKQYIERGKVDTIIFCSILHELFSYIEYNGKKFNHETLAVALRSAFEVLPAGGRIIIRDGIMTEPVNQKRIIKFLSEEGMEFLDRYVKDFKGREILYSVVGQNEVLMTVNDAMEFLYTYTWGEKSYVHEVNEQFGYFTPGGFKEFIHSALGEKVKIIEFKHFLQDGYTIALSQKIEFFDEKRNPVRLPDSTCIVVIEKM